MIGLFSLRVQTIFFAMITLAVASAFAVLASQLSWLTGGEDGRSFSVPDLLQPGTTFIPRDVLGVAVTGRTLTYYLVFVCCVLLFLLLLRVVNSPFGRVLQAIRENPFRAEALGYRTVHHRTLANCLPPWPPPRSARSMRCGCATPARTHRCRSPSCSTSC